VVAGPSGGEPPSPPPPPSAEPPKPTDADAFAPLASAPRSEADTQAAEARTRAGAVSPWLIVGGLLLVGAAVTVTVVSRRKGAMVLHITD
jgi:hypothetical protein